ncbi:Legionella secretion system protein X [Legionella israelensis]|uniref:Octanoyltransferase n=1 Tax=Legionella israelensis TaxID=454 RepID=A0A0W0VUE5_9GAMM|nr:Legionella secretion system protein X [Legionella israelensis]SCY38773.1 lipoyl(octanoyl) transferase [Legionella israelensis DSM 19235]STX58272.1 Legionella secretion system protein X [Legionella israelensis]
MIRIKQLGMQPYQAIWQQMKNFTMERNPFSDDELWLLEHMSVYTQGQAGKAEHILNPQDIPVIQTDRGGQITYHGPGQLVVYVLMDIKRKNIGIRTLVSSLEKILIAVLCHFDIKANIRCGAPGVYVDDKKIASIGLRVKNGCTYHGIALNVNMDLTPFKGINPCGFRQMEMTQISAFSPDIQMEQVCEQFVKNFINFFEQ